MANKTVEMVSPDVVDGNGLVVETALSPVVVSGTMWARVAVWGRLPLLPLTTRLPLLTAECGKEPVGTTECGREPLGTTECGRLPLGTTE